jgi:hypothetical protein
MPPAAGTPSAGAPRHANSPGRRSPPTASVQSTPSCFTHEHHDDNLDAAGRALLPSADTVLTTVSGAPKLGGSARGLRDLQTTRLSAPGRPDLEVMATACRHGPPHVHFIIGDVIGFALRWEGHDYAELWISGDTVLYDGVREVAGRVNIDTALLHIGAVRFPSPAASATR